jgi:hypothetical protein
MIDPQHRRRVLIRVASAVVAVGLLVTLVVWMLAGRNDTTRSSAAFCGRITDVSALSDALASGDRSQIRAATTQLHQAEQAAPADIAPSVRVLVAYADGLETTIATAGRDPGAIDAALADAVRAQQGENADVVTAGNTVRYWTKVTCNIDLTGATTPTTGA